MVVQMLYTMVTLSLRQAINLVYFLVKTILVIKYTIHWCTADNLSSTVFYIRQFSFFLKFMDLTFTSRNKSISETINGQVKKNLAAFFYYKLNAYLAYSHHNWWAIIINYLLRALRIHFFSQNILLSSLKNTWK